MTMPPRTYAYVPADRPEGPCEICETICDRAWSWKRRHICRSCWMRLCRDSRWAAKVRQARKIIATGATK